MTTTLWTGTEMTTPIEGTSAEVPKGPTTPQDWRARVAEVLGMSVSSFRALVAAQAGHTGLSVADQWRLRAAGAPHAGLSPVDPDGMESTMNAAFVVQRAVIEQMESEN